MPIYIVDLFVLCLFYVSFMFVLCLFVVGKQQLSCDRACPHCKKSLFIICRWSGESFSPNFPPRSDTTGGLFVLMFVYVCVQIRRGDRPRAVPQALQGHLGGEPGQ